MCIFFVRSKRYRELCDKVECCFIESEILFILGNVFFFLLVILSVRKRCSLMLKKRFLYYV